MTITCFCMQCIHCRYNIQGNDTVALQIIMRYLDSCSYFPFLLFKPITTFLLSLILFLTSDMFKTAGMHTVMFLPMSPIMNFCVTEY